MAVGRKGQRAENAACSGALSSSTITVTITAKTSESGDAIQLAVSDFLPEPREMDNVE